MMTVKEQMKKELQVMKLMLEINLDDPSSVDDASHFERGKKLLEDINKALEIINRNSGEYEDWRLTDRLSFVLVASSGIFPEDVKDDFVLAVDVIKDYDALCNGGGLISDDRLGPRPPHFNHGGVMN